MGTAGAGGSELPVSRRLPAPFTPVFLPAPLLPSFEQIKLLDQLLLRPMTHLRPVYAGDFWCNFCRDFPFNCAAITMICERLERII